MAAHLTPWQAAGSPTLAHIGLDIILPLFTLVLWPCISLIINPGTRRELPVAGRLTSSLTATPRERYYHPIAQMGK